MDFYQTCRLESNTPTPTAKNTTNGTNLYGWFVWFVKPVSIGAINSMPDINTIIDSADWIYSPFYSVISSK